MAANFSLPVAILFVYFGFEEFQLFGHGSIEGKHGRRAVGFGTYGTKLETGCR